MTFKNEHYESNSIINSLHSCMFAVERLELLNTQPSPMQSPKTKTDQGTRNKRTDITKLTFPNLTPEAVSHFETTIRTKESEPPAMKALTCKHTLAVTRTKCKKKKINY